MVLRACQRSPSKLPMPSGPQDLGPGRVETRSAYAAALYMYMGC